MRMIAREWSCKHHGGLVSRVKEWRRVGGRGGKKEAGNNNIWSMSACRLWDVCFVGVVLRLMTMLLEPVIHM